MHVHAKDLPVLLQRCAAAVEWIRPGAMGCEGNRRLVAGIGERGTHAWALPKRVFLTGPPLPTVVLCPSQRGEF